MSGGFPFATSCISGAPAVPFAAYIDPATNLTACAPSFFCPHLDPRNASTFPVYCAPLPDCALDRLFGAPCQQQQSPFEPRLCIPGHYCPPGRAQPIVCPEGTFCPPGTVTPIPCDPLSWCDPSTRSPFAYAGLVALGVTLVFVLVAVVTYLKVLRASSRRPPSNGNGPEDPLVAREAALRTLCDAFGKARCGRRPLNFDFQGLKVTLPSTLGGKQLLQGVTGHVRPGRVTAILGPSGAGKTVLFTTLLGKLDSAWTMEGELRINGEDKRDGSHKSSIGFVPQDDVLHSELTVAGNFWYSSELRLPRGWSGEERAALREAITTLLQLDAERDVGVGVAGVDGLNGGKRKAISIGVELVAAPMALFLDEPTTGLDAATSLRLCGVLKDVAVRANVSVAMVIHQPRAEIFNALDEILILAPGGYTVYQGPQSCSVAYFKDNGVHFNPLHNPADVIMDAVSERGAELARAWLELASSDGGSPSYFKKLSAPKESEAGSESGGVAAAAHAALMAAITQDYNEVAHPNEPHAIAPPASVPPVADAQSTSAQEDFETPSFLRQCIIFHVRRVEKQLAGWGDIIVEFVVIGACGLVLGQAMGGFFLSGRYKDPYKAMTPQPFDSILPQLHMYMMMSLGLAASVAGVNVFGRERSNYFRDAQSGSNRFAYFVGTATAAIYRILVGGLMFSALLHGLARLMIPYRVAFGVLTLNYMAVYGMACAVSIVANQRDSPLIAATLSILMAVFNGFIPFPNGLRYLSPAFWGSQIMHQYHDDYVITYAESTLGPWGYTRGMVDLSFAMVFLWGLFYFGIAAVLLVVTNRSRQR